MVPSVRKRRMFSLALGILTGKFDMSKNIHMTEKSATLLLSILEEISKTKVTGQESYVIKTKGTFINELKDEIESKTEQYEEVVQRTEKKKVIVKTHYQVANYAKEQYVKSLKENKAEANFNKREEKRYRNHLRIKSLMENDTFRNIMDKCRSARAYVPTYDERMGFNRETHVSGSLAPWEFGLRKIDNFPYNKENENFLLFWSKDENYSKIGDEPTRRTFHNPSIRQDILDQPDMLDRVYEEEKWVNEVYDVTLKRTRVVETCKKGSVNHLGLSQSSLEEFSSEILEISKMPGFVCLNQFLRTMPYRTKMSECYQNIRRTLEPYDEYGGAVKFKSLKGTGKQAKRKRPSKKLSRKARKKTRAEEKELIKEHDLILINSYIEENQRYYKMARETEEEELKKRIISNLQEMCKGGEQAGDLWYMSEKYFNKKLDKINLPYQIHRRYTAILYAFSHGVNLYDSLKMHFDRYHEVNRRKKRQARINLGYYCDY